MNARFEVLSRTTLNGDKTWGVMFDTPELRAELVKLREHRCLLADCPAGPAAAKPFRSAGQWKHHMRAEHGLLVCDTCVDQEPVWPRDQTCYRRDELKAHVKTHPECVFCSQAFRDDDALMRHMKATHELCTVCHNNGLKFQYFAGRDALKAHIAAEHVACPMPECVELLLAFASDTALSAHMLSQHAQELSASQRAELKRIQLQLTFSDDNRFDGRRSSDEASGRRVAPGAARGRGRPPGPSRAQQQQEASDSAMAAALALSVAEASDTDAAKLAPAPAPAGTAPAPASASATASHTSAPASESPKSRNRQLIARIREALNGDDAAFEQFRALSLAFRDGQSSVEAYYADFVNLLGADAALHVFPDLVATLPDAAKRSALIACHTRYQMQAQNFPSLAADSAAPAAAGPSLLDRKAQGSRRTYKRPAPASAAPAAAASAGRPVGARPASAAKATPSVWGAPPAAPAVPPTLAAIPLAGVAGALTAPAAGTGAATASAAAGAPRAVPASGVASRPAAAFSAGDFPSLESSHDRSAPSGSAAGAAARAPAPAAGGKRAKREQKQKQVLLRFG